MTCEKCGDITENGFDGKPLSLCRACNTAVRTEGVVQYGFIHILKRLSVFVLFAALLISMLTGNKVDSTSAKKFSSSDKIRICKAYIAEIFQKPVSIMSSYNNDHDLTYVRYTRSSDNTVWSYVCDISSNRITWAGWQNDLNDWGRWRTEDEVSLTFDETSNSVSFVVYAPDRVVVKL